MTRGSTGTAIIRSFRRRIDAVLPLKVSDGAADSSSLGFQLGVPDGADGMIQMM